MGWSGQVGGAPEWQLQKQQPHWPLPSSRTVAGLSGTCQRPISCSAGDPRRGQNGAPGAAHTLGAAAAMPHPALLSRYCSPDITPRQGQGAWGLTQLLASAQHPRGHQDLVTWEKLSLILKVKTQLWMWWRSKPPFLGWTGALRKSHRKWSKKKDERMLGVKR